MSAKKAPAKKATRKIAATKKPKAPAPSPKKSKKKAAAKRPTTRSRGPASGTAPRSGPSAAPAAARAAEELLLVCVQAPFPQTAASIIVQSTVPSTGGTRDQIWRLEAVLEMNPPRFFAGWATTALFTLDVKVNAMATPTAGTWGNTERTATAPGACQVLIMRDGDKVKFSLASGAKHAPEKAMPRPDPTRRLNADVAFEQNGPNGITAAAVSVISDKAWASLIAGSTAATKGLAFDGKWRSNLGPKDGASLASGSWAFSVMTRSAYSSFCTSLRLTEHIEG